MSEHTHNHTPEDDQIEEITLEVTEEGLVWVQGTGWEFFLSPGEARELASALKEIADEAEESS